MGENQRPRPHGLVTRVHSPAGPELSGRSGRDEKARVVKDAGFCYSRNQDPTPAPLFYQGNGPPPESEMNSRLSAVSETPVYADSTPGVQLVHPDVAQATQPGLFDNIPEPNLNIHHRAIIDARVGDRMLLCLSLEVSASAVKVAVALAFHGWSSWPSRDTLATQTKLHPNHVSRASKELEDAGIIRRQRRYHKGGNVGIQYTFNGPALIAAAVNQDHPTLSPAIHALHSPEIAANTNLVSAEEEPRNQNSGANTNLVSAEEEEQEPGTDANTNLVSAQPGAPDREYQIGIGANTNLVPEPERIEPERIMLIDDVNQSNSGSSGSISPDAKSFAAATELPAWYQELERQLDAAIVPDFNTIQEAAMLAGWTDQVMAAAARLYARNYRNQRVNNASSLFRKLASQEASKVAVPPKQSRPSYSDERRRRR